MASSAPIFDPPRPSYDSVLKEKNIPLHAQRLDTLQLMLNDCCGAACHHCYFNCTGSGRRSATAEVIEATLETLASVNELATLEIVGGAVEEHPQFPELIARTAFLGKHIRLRTTLFAIAQDNRCLQEMDLPALLAKHGVEIVAALPTPFPAPSDVAPANVQTSIAAIRRLNAAGYNGHSESSKLNLVCHPSGAFLPPAEEELERLWRAELQERYGIIFDRLWLATNLPIRRFGDQLRQLGGFEEYLDLLRSAFSERAALAAICRNSIYVAPDGKLFDCCFNGNLGIGMKEADVSIFNADWAMLKKREIAFARHCFACAANSGQGRGQIGCRKSLLA